MDLDPAERSELINRDLPTRDDAVMWLKHMKEAGLDFPVSEGLEGLNHHFQSDEVQEIRNQFARIDQLYGGDGYQALVDGGWELDPSDVGESIMTEADKLIGRPLLETFSEEYGADKPSSNGQKLAQRLAQGDVSDIVIESNQGNVPFEIVEWWEAGGVLHIGIESRGP